MQNSAKARKRPFQQGEYSEFLVNTTSKATFPPLRCTENFLRRL